MATIARTVLVAILAIVTTVRAERTKLPGFVQAAAPRPLPAHARGTGCGRSGSVACHAVSSPKKDQKPAPSPWSAAYLWNRLANPPVNTPPVEDEQEKAQNSKWISEVKEQVRLRQARNVLEGQLSSILHIESSSFSNKACEQIRLIAEDLEALQRDAQCLPSARDPPTLAGSWRLVYTGGKDADPHQLPLQSVETISYISEHYRLSHSGDIIRVFKRVLESPTEDDTSLGKANSKRRSKSAAAAVARVAEQPGMWLAAGMKRRLLFRWTRQ
ncbi:unnamed protein product [Discosporangium mesarthrocarpum]